MGEASANGRKKNLLPWANIQSEKTTKQTDPRSVSISQTDVVILPCLVADVRAEDEWTRGSCYVTTLAVSSKDNKEFPRERRRFSK